MSKTTSVSVTRLDQIAQEVRLLWHLYQLGVMTFYEALVEVNARRVELGYCELTDFQAAELKVAMERRGTL